MANRIKGITVEIGGDTTKLSKALEGINKDIKGTQTQLKDVQKLLKLDPTNTELLSQKHKLLADAVSATEQKSKVKTNRRILRISSQVRRFLFVLKTGAFQKILGAFLPTKKRLRKQKTGSEGNPSRFFCF